MTSLYKHIDPCVLLNLVDQDLMAFGELSQTFLSIAPPMFQQLQDAVLAGDYPLIANRAHALKGTTVLVGATSLTQMLGQIESDARQGNSKGGSDVAARIQPVFAAVVLEVASSIAYVMKGNKI